MCVLVNPQLNFFAGLKYPGHFYTLAAAAFFSLVPHLIFVPSGKISAVTAARVAFGNDGDAA